MDRSEQITLLATATTQSEFGVWEESYTPTTVFCQVDSVTRAEFFDAGRNGLNPEFRMTMFRWDYDGQRLLEYNGQTYSVYRTYFARDDTVELYVERKGGTNGKESAT